MFQKFLSETFSSVTKLWLRILAKGKLAKSFGMEFHAEIQNSTKMRDVAWKFFTVQTKKKTGSFSVTFAKVLFPSFTCLCLAKLYMAKLRIRNSVQAFEVVFGITCTYNKDSHCWLLQEETKKPSNEVYYYQLFIKSPLGLSDVEFLVKLCLSFEGFTLQAFV